MTGTKKLRVSLLGGLRVQRGTEVLGLRDLGGLKPRQIFLLLLLHRGARLGKSDLVSLLWPTAPPPDATATLESYVCVLRRAIHIPGGPRDSIIRTMTGGYAIDMDEIDLDTVRFDALVEMATQTDCSTDRAVRLLTAALTIGDASLLPEEAGSTWIDEERRLHAGRLSTARAAAARAALMAGRVDQALHWAQRNLAEDDLDEGALLTVVEALEQAGRHADALRVYDECRRRFATELGCAPGPRLQAAFMRLLNGTADEDDELAQILQAATQLHAFASRACTSPPDALADAREVLAGLLSSTAGIRRYATPVSA